MKIRRLIATLIAVSAFVGTASAQFYSWGADPVSLRWNRIKTPAADIIYPDSSAQTARRTLFYIENVKPFIGHGFRHSAMKMPFILHPENFSSNGMVMYLPKRVELLTSPAINSYSMPWMKQLVAHEYRHTVQYNNLNRGVVRVLSYILGQQSSTFGLLFLPLWVIEGDAVLNETQMSSFGRGLQPSFSIDYRALGNIARLGRNTDKWFCGSYRDNVPDHYHIGYQIVSYAYTKYNENIWDQVAWYSVRNPYVIATTAVSLKKFYKTSVIKLTRETFDNLAEYWDSLPQTEDSASILPQAEPQRSYTTYRHPLQIDANTLLSLKSDFDTPSRFVTTDIRTGQERKLAFTGTLSTRHAFDGKRIWWTEYRRSLLFEERVNSTLCWMSLDDNNPHTIRKRRNALYPTPISEDELAWVEYDLNGVYHILRGDGVNEHSRVTVPRFTEIHGLAYDDLTRRLYFIATDDDGMRLGGVNEEGELFSLTQGAYITLSDLRAANGMLYFGSIESGKDEIHCFDIARGREYRLTQSRYGSFGGSSAAGDSIVLTVYDRNGYHPAVQPAGLLRQEVAQRKLPRNTVNPPRTKWDVINLDTVRYTAADSVASHQTHKARRYSKTLHLFNIHSWAPVSYNPFEIIEEGLVRFNLGATVMSQNLLSDSEMSLTYGWNRTEGSFVEGTWRYYGLGVNLALNAFYGGSQKVYTVGRYNPETGRIETPDVPHLGKYYSVSASASLPLLFQSGYHTRHLVASASYNFSNGRIARVEKINFSDLSNFRHIGYDSGLHTLQFAITYQDMVRLAHRDFAPKFGVVLNAAYAINPQNSDFQHLFSTYARFYLPGFAPHHSISVAAAYQTSVSGFNNENILSQLSYTSSRLLPRGYRTRDIRNNNYIAESFNYQLPVCYPDGGIPSVLYFKRIRLNLGFDYATFRQKTFSAAMGNGHIVNIRKHIFSYGGDIILDLNLFRQPAAATTSVTLSAYVTREGRPYFTAGIGLPF